MTQVTLPGSGGTVAFKYDPFGRRVQKLFTQGSTTTTTNYVYDGSNSVQDVDQNGILLARYAETASIDEPLAESRSGTTSYYEADGLGSVTSLTSSAGALANTYTYESFGKLTASTGSITNRFQYTARELDSETGLYFYRARYFDPNAGRFLGEDAARFRAGADFYTYVHNRPTVLRDPTGRFAWGIGATGAGNIGMFWRGAGAEGGFYYVHDTQGNDGVLDCRAGGIGAVNGVSASVQFTGLICPNCQSICDMEGTFGGATGFGGVGVNVAAGGGATLSSNSATFSGGIGVGAGAGGGLVGVVGDCTLIWKKKNCPSCSAPPHK